MRVLETALPPKKYTMPGKKKHKIRKQCPDNDPNLSDSSDECGLPSIGCQHVTKAINFSSMKKGLKQMSPLGECTNCLKENQSRQKPDRNEALAGAASSSAHDEGLLEEAELTIWVCLRCGNQGCDRNSKDKHALKHYQTPHSDSHSIVVNLSTWIVWCYDCDDEVIPDSNKKLVECVEYLRRLSGITHTEAARPETYPEMERSETPDKDQKTRSVAGAGGGGATEHVNNVIKVLPAPNPVIPALPKVKGLNNLGNTCFFNAVMQSLSQTYELEATLSEQLKKGLVASLPGKQPDSTSDSDESTDDEDCENNKAHLNLQETLTITLPEGGMLSQSVLSFLRDMNTSRNNSISPSGLFSQICKKAPRFKGFQQQDSHELLRTLLDGMRAEEVKRAQSGILRAFNLPENVKPNKVDDDTKTKIKEYGREAKHTFVENIFGGYFISTVLCEECHVPSQIFEQFLDLSLSISEEKPLRPNSGWGSKKKDSTPSVTMATSLAASQPDKPLSAVDGFAANATAGESKHQKKKAKKDMRREAKIARKVRKNKVSPESLTSEPSPSNEEKTIADAMEKEKDIAMDNSDKKSKDESNSNGDDEEYSDADVEDNLESDVSRNRFQCLGDDHESDSGGSITKTSLLKLPDPATEEEDDDVGAASALIGHNTQVKPTGGVDSNQKHTQPVFSTANGHLSDNVSCTDSNRGHLGNSLESNGVRKSGHLSSGSNNQLTAEQDKSYDSLIENGKDSSDTNVLNDIDKVTKDLDSLDLDCQSSSTTLTGSTISAISTSVGCNGELDDTLEEGGDVVDDNVIDADEKIQTNGIASTMSAAATQMDGATVSVTDTAGGTTKSEQTNHTSKSKSEAILKAMLTLAPRYQTVSHECSVMSCLNQFTSAELLTGNNRFGCRHCTRRKHKKLGASGGKKETVYSNANKQVLLYCPPAILTLHLKRFEQAGYSLRKVNKHVDFPLLLDLAPYCSSLCQGVQPGQTKVLYSLYGVVEHSGRLTGGHYTAYVKVRPKNHKTRSFLQSNDFNIKNVNLAKVLEERLPHMNNGDTPKVEEESPVTIGKWFYISDSRVNEVTEQSVLNCQAYLLFYERIY